MPKEARFFMAELMATQQALKEKESLENRYWTVYSDSQLTLQSNYTDQSIRWCNQFHEILHRNSNRKVVLYKVPSHTNNMTGYLKKPVKLSK